MRSLPLRLRLTLAFALVMAVLLGATGLLVYDFFRSDLNNNIDSSLQGRSEAVSGIARSDSDRMSASSPAEIKEPARYLGEQRTGHAAD